MGCNDIGSNIFWGIGIALSNMILGIKSCLVWEFWFKGPTGQRLGRFITMTSLRRAYHDGNGRDEHLATSVATIYFIHVMLEEGKEHLSASFARTIFPLTRSLDQDRWMKAF